MFETDSCTVEKHCLHNFTPIAPMEAVISMCALVYKSVCSTKYCTYREENARVTFSKWLTWEHDVDEDGPAVNNCRNDREKIPQEASHF